MTSKTLASSHYQVVPTRPLLMVYPRIEGAARLDCISLFEGSGTVQVAVNEAALLRHDAGEEMLVVSTLDILKAPQKGMHCKVFTGVKWLPKCKL